MLCDIFAVFVTNNFNFSRKFSIHFLYLSLTAIPFVFCFNALDNIRKENGGIKLKIESNVDIS